MLIPLAVLNIFLPLAVLLPVVWLLKPLYSISCISIYGKLAFNTIPMLNFSPVFLKNLAFTSFLKIMFLHRFLPTRTFILPVRVLERLRGKKARKRSELLSQGIEVYHVRWYGYLLAFAEILMVSAPFAALLMFTQYNFLTPPDFDVHELFLRLQEGSFGSYIIIKISYSVSVFLMEPLFVAIGFSSYLYRRARLEYWDIEIAFRSLNESLSTKGKIL